MRRVSLMRHPRLPVAAGLVLALVLATPGTSPAQMAVPTGRETLRGLPGVEVLVEPLQPGLEAAGLAGGGLREAVVAQLTRADVPMYASQGQNAGPSQAYLYVHVNALSLPDGGGYAVALGVQVRQAVDSLAGPARIVDAVTWDTHTVLTLPPDDFASLYGELSLHVQRFIDDWRAVH